VVEAVMFLASDRRAGFITGEALNVSGGWYMRP
jgi:NAD(P)-dependent dehydrogenase (short-subunit alcohol dehydrogenase family)